MNKAIALDGKKQLKIRGKGYPKNYCHVVLQAECVETIKHLPAQYITC